MELLVKEPDYKKNFVGKLRKKSKVQHVWTAKIDSWDFKLEFLTSMSSKKVRLILNSGVLFESNKDTERVFDRAFYFKGYKLMLIHDYTSIDLTINSKSFKELVSTYKLIGDKTNHHHSIKVAEKTKTLKIEEIVPSSAQFYTYSPRYDPFADYQTSLENFSRAKHIEKILQGYQTSNK